LTELRKTLYNPALSKYGARFKGRSSKLEAIAEYVDQQVAAGEKVIIKTNYVTNVLDDIVEAVGHDPLVVVGDTAREDRNSLYWQFKNNPKKPVLIVSSVGEESVDLTTGDTPLTLVPYEPEINPREFNQFSGRGYRRHQRAPVTHATFVTQSETLNQMMIGYLQNLAEEHGIKVPKKFKPRTIDVDMLGMRRAKDSIVNKIYGGDKITKKEESVYDVGEVDRAVTHLEGLVKPSTFKNMQPFELSSLIQTRWRNLGEEQFESLVSSKGWKKWRNLYEDGWNGSASQATNVLLGSLVDKVADSLEYEPVIVSVGDGRAYFSRASGRGSVGIDIDKKWLEQGKRDCEKKKIPYEFIHASATDTTLPENFADVLVNAYSIFYLGQDEERNEVESAVVESNRILKDGGRLMLALPCSLDDKIIGRFGSNLEEYGFKEATYLSPKQTKNNGMKNGVHILSYQKVDDVSEPLGHDLSFYLNREVFVG
jgi:SAM-dependent methyltransferase